MLASPRFIPAGAGNSPAYATMKIQKPVYPRWRGELHYYGDLNSRIIGLSPLARGTHHRLFRRGYRVRFIPAGAGNSSSLIVIDTFGSVYPRWRGELGFNFAVEVINRGLSPLARGTLLIGANHASSRRFIPAGAGNSSTCSANGWPSPVYPRWRGELGAAVFTFA